MKAFFDARYIDPEFHNGISRYSAELGTSLANIRPITFLINDTKQLDLLPQGAKYIKIHAPTSLLEPISGLVLNKYKPDVVFSPMQTMGSLGRKYKLILTQHDLIYYEHKKPPSQFNPLIKLGWRLYHSSYIPGRIVLNGADAVATVSQTVKQQLIAKNMTKRSIHVLPNAPRDFKSLVPLNLKLKQQKPRQELNNLIYMGSFMPYKDVELLIRALALLPAGYNLHLLSRISKDRREQLEKLNTSKNSLIFHNGVTDKEYARLLANQAIMVSASKSEGFGLPIVEAMNMGVPTVLRDTTIFREVGGPGSLFFDNEQDFAAKINLLNNNPETRQDFLIKSKKHLKNYSWKESAKKLDSLMVKLTQ